jgi:hypothetical protein
MGLLTTSSVAIDGSKFKAVNTRDKNFTRGKVERRRAQLVKSVARYLAQLDTADLQEPSEELAAKTAHRKEKLVNLEGEMQRLAAMEKLMLASPDQQTSLTDPDSRSMATSGRGSGMVGYNVQVAVDTKHHLIVTRMRCGVRVKGLETFAPQTPVLASRYASKQTRNGPLGTSVEQPRLRQ